MMPTSFLDLPLKLRGEIYNLIIPNKGRANGELFSVNKIDTTYWEDDPLLNNDPPTILPISRRTFANSARRNSTPESETAEDLPPSERRSSTIPLLPTAVSICSLDPGKHWNEWLDGISPYQTHLRHIAIAACRFFPFLPRPWMTTDRTSSGLHVGICPSQSPEYDLVELPYLLSR